MSGFSYDEWNDQSQEQQANNHGVSITRSHPVNNPDRFPYISGATAASALATYIQGQLTHENPQISGRMFRLLKSLNNKAVESPRAVQRAMLIRQVDAHRALNSSNFSFTDEQMEQVQTVADDIYRLQEKAQLAGLNELNTSRVLINLAVAQAVGFDPSNLANNPEVREFIIDPAVNTDTGNLNQGVAQLYSLMRTNEIDALDTIGKDLDTPLDRGTELEFLKDAVGTIPLVRNPSPITPETHFSVRMDTKEEANVMETIIRWTAQLEEQPDTQKIHRAFNSWRDAGLTTSPFSDRDNNSLGIIVGNTDIATNILDTMVAESNPNQTIIVLTSQNDRIGNEIAGRPVVLAEIEADLHGIKIANLETAPKGSIIVMNLNAEQTQDSVERSLAANAMVGSVSAVAHLAGNTLTVLEAQAIHISGSARKMAIATDSNGNELKPAGLKKLRKFSQEVDFQANPNLYLTRGGSRPTKGVVAVGWITSNNFDIANKKNAPEKDILGEMYSRIPHDAVILTMDNEKNAGWKHLSNLQEKGELNRPIFYAEATRVLTNTEVAGGGPEGQKQTVREATNEFAIYDCPAKDRKYKIEGNGPAARNVCISPEIDWNDKRLKGAVILVHGNPLPNAANGATQAIKVAQESVVDHSHAVIVANEMLTDYNAATGIHHAYSMGKRTTVIDSTGKEVPLAEARERTKQFAQTITEVDSLNTDKHVHGSLEGLPVTSQERVRAEQNRRNSCYGLDEDFGQMALAALPKMNADKASKLAKNLAGHGLTLDDLRTTPNKAGPNEELQQLLFKNGMPGDTIKNHLHVQSNWTNAVKRAALNTTAAENLGAVYQRANSNSVLPEGKAGFTCGDNPNMPVALFFGATQRTDDGSKEMKDPADLQNRPELLKTMTEMVKQGFAIGVTMEEGISRAVMEEAAKIPGAKVVMATYGNPMAASPELRMAMIKLDENGQLFTVMPDHIAATPFKPEKKSTIFVDGFVENRDTMYDNIAHIATVGILVAASDSDQAMHIADRCNKLGKPLAAMIPQKAEQCMQDHYRGNLKLVLGPNKTNIKSVGQAVATSAQGYANIVDYDTKFELTDGVMRGNAGAFTSVRIARNDMMRSGHSYAEMTWGKAAYTIDTPEAAGRFGQASLEGRMEPLGQLVGPTARDMEKRSLALEASVDPQVLTEFSKLSKVHSTQISADAAYHTGLSVTR